MSDVTIHSTGVCSNIIHLDQKKLQFYTGNYDMFVQTRCELLENQMKQYKWEQDQIANMKVRNARLRKEDVECNYGFTI